MARTKKVEIWATFENGLSRYVETARTAEAAQSAIDAMNSHNRNDLANGGGFPYGVPYYTIKPFGTRKACGEIISR